ncbi:molecular chaperone TorD family protein [Desulfitobacterium dichloroeliminans]|uniref:molecular chaperone TorD family protein n=1 Tax=Desulfitobacterium dichloroeliminans TaxID=233055 RepID=UPI0002DEDE74|nr:molecular chaperone TorD family protein [Desulfitobacterium dichloroeliminans]
MLQEDENLFDRHFKVLSALAEAMEMNVRRAYLKYKFLPSNYPHEADDHIGLKLDFMAHLSQLA